jgi:hypothetical protein
MTPCGCGGSPSGTARDERTEHDDLRQIFAGILDVVSTVDFIRPRYQPAAREKYEHNH